MSRRRVQFHVRVVPDERNERECLEIDNDRKVIWFSNERDRRMSREPYIKFETDGVFTDACQADIYSTVIGNELHRFVSGASDVVVLAFGLNGTGKTYTMSGIRDHYHFRGIIPRLLDGIFDIKKKKYLSMKLCALEFQHGKCRDLLRTSAPEIDCRKVSAVRLNAAHEALDLLFKAESNRCTISDKNCGSMVVTVTIKQPQRSVRRPVIQKIHLVDTSGTEVHWSKLRESTCRMKNDQYPGFRLDPSSDWAFLAGLSIRGKLDPQQAFRNALMVGYLCRSLHQGNIRLIGHIRRGSDHLRYTLETLRYGCSLTGRPEIVASKITITSPSNTINEALAKEVQELRDELALTDLLDNGTVPITATPGKEEDLFAEVENYFEDPEIGSCDALLRLAHPFALMVACKYVFKRGIERLQNDYDMEGGEATEGPELTPTRGSKRSTKSKKKSVRDPAVEEALEVKLKEQLAAQVAEQAATKTDGREKSSVPNEQIEEGKSNRAQLWKEFLSRYPHLHTTLTAIAEDLKRARDDREIIDEQVKDLKRKLHANKLELERTNWERTKAVGQPVDAKGQPIYSTDEQKALKEEKALQEAYKQAMVTFKEVHEVHMGVLDRFNQAHEDANKLFTEYVSTTYENVLIIPATEDYEENIPLLTSNTSIQPTITKSEEEFIELQNEHLYRDKRDPRPPRWP